MRGVSKEITLPVAFLGFARDPWGNEKAGFELETKLRRKDFGIVWNVALDTGGFVLGDEVAVTITLETQREKTA
jgi:polyisoprenoid-binding protein YceI